MMRFVRWWLAAPFNLAAALLFAVGLPTIFLAIAALKLGTLIDGRLGACAAGGGEL